MHTIIAVKIKEKENKQIKSMSEERATKTAEESTPYMCRFFFNTVKWESKLWNQGSRVNALLHIHRNDERFSTSFIYTYIHVRMLQTF